MTEATSKAVPKKTKQPVLAEKIAEFIAALEDAANQKTEFDHDTVSKLWDDEMRYHFDNGRTEKTIILYVAKYREAIRAAFGPKSVALSICNTKKLKNRLASYIKGGEYSQTGTAESIEQRIERAEDNIVGRKPTLLLQISLFIESLNGIDDEGSMRALWAREIKNFEGKAQTTVISYITKYRNAIKEAFGAEHPMLRIAAGDPAMYEDSRKRKMETIAKKNGALITFDNWQEVITLCTDCLRTNDPLLIGIGLMGVTGRRPFEVFTQAKFSQARYGKGISKWSVLFSGQAKTKERVGTKFGVTYEIPALAPAELVLDAYKRLRKSSDGKYWHKMSLEGFTADSRIPLRNEVKKLFGHLWPREEMPKPYGLRHLYAEVAYTKFAPKTVSKNSYYAAILGHNNNDLETSLSYMTYCLPEDQEEAKMRANRASLRTHARLVSL